MTEERFLKLRCTLSKRIGSRRFSHTLGVEQMIIELGELYLPGDISRLRVAALLHDLTKEWTGEEQVGFCKSKGFPLTERELEAPKSLHARTAAYLAEREFSTIVDAGILVAIERHTTGDAQMTVFDELLYLADYIEPTRTYPECIALRDAFFEGFATAASREAHLHATVLSALRMTVKEIEERGGTILPKTLDAIEYLAKKLEAEL